MADPDVSHSSSADEDQDFDPSSGDVTMHDMDDERTIDEEEALGNEDSVANELDDLHKESEIPVELLLAMYGYVGSKKQSSSSSSSQGSARVESSLCCHNIEDNSNSNNDINNDNVTATTSTSNSNANDDDNLPSSSSSSSSSNQPSSSTTNPPQDNIMTDNEVMTNNNVVNDSDNVVNDSDNVVNDSDNVVNDSDASQYENSQSEGNNRITSEIKLSVSLSSSSTPTITPLSSANNACLTNMTSFANIDVSSEARTNSMREHWAADKMTCSDVVGSSNGAGLPPSTADLLSSDLMDVGSDDDEDYDPEQEEEDWKKSVSVGPEFQAVVPDCPNNDEEDSRYNMEDRILWNPENLNEADVEAYLLEVHRQHQPKSNPPNKNLPSGAPARDDEQALYLLYQCNNNFEEALRRQKLQAVPQPDPMSLWTEEECRGFETGLRLYGKDFFLNQQKVKTRSVREIVQFYYLWKKTERHDAFAARTRMEKKKYNLHPGVTDYMDRFISEFETPLVDTTGNSNNLGGTMMGHGMGHTNKHCMLTSEMVRRMDSAKHSTMPFPINNFMETASNDAQCCDGLMVYCNIPSGVSCSYDDANSASNLFPQNYNNSNSCHLLPNDVSSTANFFASSIYEYPATSSSSVNNHLPSCSGLPSSYHLDHLPPQPDLTCYPSQVDSTYIPVATQVFGNNMCNSPTSLSFHTNPVYYPVVDSLSSSSSFPNKQPTDCLMPEVDVESLIASPQMSSVVGPQELSISEINMIFGNVERPVCEHPGAVNSNNMNSNARGGEMMGAGDASGFSGVSCMASSSDTPTFLPPSMQKLCSEDGVGATLESISASIQELVGPENAISPENLLSVLEGNSVNSSNNPSSSSINPSSSANHPSSVNSSSSSPINALASSSTNSTASSSYIPGQLLPSSYSSSDDKISSCSGLNSTQHPPVNHLESCSNSIDNNNVSPFCNSQQHPAHLAESSTTSLRTDVQHPTNSINPNLMNNRYINNNNNFSVSSSNAEANDNLSPHNDANIQQSLSQHALSQLQQQQQQPSSPQQPSSQQQPSPPHHPTSQQLPASSQHPPREQSREPIEPSQMLYQPPINRHPPPPLHQVLPSHPSPPLHQVLPSHSHLITSSTPSSLIIDPPISSDFSKACSDSTSIKS